MKSVIDKRSVLQTHSGCEERKWGTGEFLGRGAGKARGKPAQKAAA